MPTSQMSARLSFNCFTSIQHPANASGQTAESGPSTWDPATHVENLGRIPGSTFSLVQPGQEN